MTGIYSSLIIPIILLDIKLLSCVDYVFNMSRVTQFVLNFFPSSFIPLSFFFFFYLSYLWTYFEINFNRSIFTARYVTYLCDDFVLYHVITLMLSSRRLLEYRYDCSHHGDESSPKKISRGDLERSRGGKWDKIESELKKSKYD